MQAAAAAIPYVGWVFAVGQMISSLVQLGLNEYKQGDLSKRIMNAKQQYFAQYGNQAVEEAIRKAPDFQTAVRRLSMAPPGTSGQVQFGVGDKFAGMNINGQAGTQESPEWRNIIAGIAHPGTLAEHPDLVAGFIQNLWVQTGPGGATNFDPAATRDYQVYLLSKLPNSPEWIAAKQAILNSEAVDPRDQAARDRAIAAAPKTPVEPGVLRVNGLRLPTDHRYQWFDGASGIWYDYAPERVAQVAAPWSAGNVRDVTTGQWIGAGGEPRGAVDRAYLDVDTMQTPPLRARAERQRDEWAARIPPPFVPTGAEFEVPPQTYNPIDMTAFSALDTYLKTPTPQVRAPAAETAAPPPPPLAPTAPPPAPAPAAEPASTSAYLSVGPLRLPRARAYSEYNVSTSPPSWQSVSAEEIERRYLQDPQRYATGASPTSPGGLWGVMDPTSGEFLWRSPLSTGSWNVGTMPNVFNPAFVDPASPEHAAISAAYNAPPPPPPEPPPPDYPSLQGGGRVPTTGLYRLHAGERVVPADSENRWFLSPRRGLYQSEVVFDPENDYSLMPVEREGDDALARELTDREARWAAGERVIAVPEALYRELRPGFEPKVERLRVDQHERKHGESWEPWRPGFLPPEEAEPAQEIPEGTWYLDPKRGVPFEGATNPEPRRVWRLAFDADQLHEAWGKRGKEGWPLLVPPSVLTREDWPRVVEQARRTQYEAVHPAVLLARSVPIEESGAMDVAPWPEPSAGDEARFQPDIPAPPAAPPSEPVGPLRQLPGSRPMRPDERRQIRWPGPQA